MNSSYYEQFTLSSKEIELIKKKHDKYIFMFNKCFHKYISKTISKQEIKTKITVKKPKEVIVDDLRIQSFFPLQCGS